MRQNENLYKKEITTKAPKNEYKKKPFRTLIFILVMSFITAALLFYYHDQSETEQSLTYFPDDPALLFESAKTSIQFHEGLPYTLKWKVDSKINELAYLRQDVSFLFKDQRLIGILSEWKEETDVLSQTKNIKENQSGFYESISVHHAESHYPHNVIRGKEKMSYDHLSVMKQGETFMSFKIPTSESQKQWSTTSWKTLQLKQKALVMEAARQFHFNPQNYDIFPLSYLHIYENHPLPGLTQKITHRVISQLWEGIYKDYALGIHLSENEIRNPIGSAMPIILYSKNADSILVVIQLDTGEMTLLKQVI